MMSEVPANSTLNGGNVVASLDKAQYGNVLEASGKHILISSLQVYCLGPVPAY